MTTEARTKIIEALESYVNSDCDDDYGCIYRVCCATEPDKEDHDPKCIAMSALALLRADPEPRPDLARIKEAGDAMANAIRDMSCEDLCAQCIDQANIVAAWDAATK